MANQSWAEHTDKNTTASVSLAIISTFHWVTSHRHPRCIKSTWHTKFGLNLGIINMVLHWITKYPSHIQLAASLLLHMEATPKVLLNWMVYNASPEFHLLTLIIMPLNTTWTSTMLTVQVCLNSSVIYMLSSVCIYIMSLHVIYLLIQILACLLSQNSFHPCTQFCDFSFFENEQSNKTYYILHSSVTKNLLKML